MSPKQTQEAHGHSAIVLHSMKSKNTTQNDSVRRRDWIAEQVAATVEAMGGEMSATALNIFVEDVWSLPDEVILAALARSRREIRGKNGFPPTLTIADVLERAGLVSETEVENSECRAAWDEVQRYILRHVVRNPQGVYIEQDFVGNRGRVPKPELPQRIRDTVRHVGGWRAIAYPSADDFPFVQRRFYEEYRACPATELAAKALVSGAEMAKLTAKTSFPSLQPKRGSETAKRK
jgi:hypothetical protein